MFSVKMESQQKKRRRIALQTLRRMLFQFFCKSDADLHTVDKAGAFVVTAEGADRVNDPIYLLQGQAVHSLVQRLEVRPDLFVVVGIVLVVAFVEHGQHGLGIAVAGWVLLDVGFEGFQYCFHDITVLLGFG